MYKSLILFLSVFLVSCSVHKPVAKAQEEIILEGKLLRSDLDHQFKWFDENYRKYHPNDSAISELRKYSNDIRVVVIMGTWCSDSHEHVPEFFTVADALHIEEKNIEIIGVNRKKTCKSVDIREYKIQNVPTFIFYRNNRQIGSIIESPRVSIEKDLLHIIEVMK